MENKGDFNYRKELSGAVKVFDADGEVCATFGGNEEGAATAFALFKNGLARHGGYTLYNLDTEKFDVGDVGQLAEG